MSRTKLVFQASWHCKSVLDNVAEPLHGLTGETSWHLLAPSAGQGGRDNLCFPPGGHKGNAPFVRIHSPSGGHGSQPSVDDGTRQAQPYVVGRRRIERLGRLDSSRWAVISPLDLSPGANERQPALCDVDKPRLRARRQGGQRLQPPAKGLWDAPAQLVSSGALDMSRGALGKWGRQQKRGRLCYGKHRSEPSFCSGSWNQAFIGRLYFLLFILFYFNFFHPELSCMGPGGEKIIET